MSLGFLRHPLSPLAFVLGLIRSRGILLVLTRKDVRTRYAGSLLGAGWVLLMPVMMLAVYGLVLGGVLGIRFPGYGESPIGFAAALFCGLVVFQLFGESLSVGPRLILGAPALVKNFDVPLEVVPAAAVLSRSLSFLAGFAILAVVGSALGLSTPLRALSAFVLAAPVLLAALGVAWLTSAVGAYVRDLEHNVAPLATALLFLSAVFYPLASAAPEIQAVLAYNPLAGIIEASRVMLMTGQTPDWSGYGVACGACWALAWAGWLVFYRLKAGFADVI